MLRVELSVDQGKSDRISRIVTQTDQLIWDEDSTA